MTPLVAALHSLDLTPARTPIINEKINIFIDLFIKWNRRINLSAARTERELEEHVIDSLHVVPPLLAETERSPGHRAKPEMPDQRSKGSAERNERGGRMKYDLLAETPLRLGQQLTQSSAMRVLDVGTGGGLPAVIVAICLPDALVTALEPVRKKHAFLRTTARELSLSNFEPQAERVGDHLHRDYDAAMSRATFDLREWLLFGLDFVRPGGLVLGFEAAARSDLPPDVQRHPYRLGSKSRAIVTLRRSS